jgi:O-antigen ligase
MLVCLPLIGGLFVHGTRVQKVLAIVLAPLVLNVLLLCNSRGAFLALIGAGVAFLLVARGPARKKALKALALGGLALFLLLGDPQISSRFMTTFVGGEQRDQSASSRLDFWRAGLAMLADYPLGDGGNSFKYVQGGRYISRVTGSEQDRSLHNGYLEQATSWGVQGLLLRLLLQVGAMMLALRTIARCRLEDRGSDALVGICLVVGAAALLIHSMVGSFLNNEWGYWVVALLLRYGELYAVPDAVSATEGTAALQGVTDWNPRVEPAASVGS